MYKGSYVSVGGSGVVIFRKLLWKFRRFLTTDRLFMGLLMCLHLCILFLPAKCYYG